MLSSKQARQGSFQMAEEAILLMSVAGIDVFFK